MDLASYGIVINDWSRAPSTLEAGKAVDAYGALPGNTAEQAYTQALMQGVETWVEIPAEGMGW